MKIKRYELKDPRISDAFGTVMDQYHTFDFDWYVRPEKIGIASCATFEARAFLSGIWRDNELILQTNYRYRPAIRLGNNKAAAIRAHNWPKAYDPVLSLIELLGNNDTTYMFVSEAYDEAGFTRDVLTFATERPSREHNKRLWKPLHITEEETLEERLMQLEQELKRKKSGA